MRIVIATPLYPPDIGGPATYVRELEEGLPGRGIEPIVVKFGEVRHLPSIIRHYVYYRRLREALKGADTVLALDPVSVGYPAYRAAKKCKKPFVVKIVGDYAWEQGRQRFGVTEHLDEFVTHAQSSMRVRFFQKIQTRVAAAATRVIVPSEYLKNIVATWGVSSERTAVIYNGVTLPDISSLLNQRPKGFSIVSSGRRVPWKGFEALERIVAKHPDWHLRIVFGISREEALSLVRAADVFVLNSQYEGFSHALVEAILLGTPVVATDAGGNPELIHDEATGLLVPAGDEAALEAALARVESEPDAARSRAVAARERAAEFTIERMLDATAKLLTASV